MHISMKPHQQHDESLDALHHQFNNHNNWFTTELPLVLLFETWTIKNGRDLALGCLALVILAVAYEWIKHYRIIISERRDKLKVNGKLNHEDNRSSQLISNGKQTEDVTEEEDLQRFTFSVRVLDNLYLLAITLIHGVQLLVAYTLMLVVMTFHVYLILSIIIGSMIGTFTSQYKWKWSSNERQPL